MIKAIVFDLDGTLLDTVPDIAGAMNRAVAVGTCWERLSAAVWAASPAKRVYF